VRIRRRLPWLVGVTLVGWIGLAWAGHPASRSVVTISPESLKKLIDSQRAVVLPVDLRPAQEYRVGRLPGAVSMSFEEAIYRIVELAPRNVVVLYCTCSTDTITPLYDRLRLLGYRNLLFLEEGFDGWRSRGYLVEH
jgi:rhodanese-related sulfurtransferase